MAQQSSSSNTGPWYTRKVTQGFKWSTKNTKGHSGIDLACPLGTPITSPVAGQVVGASCKKWGIQVDVRFTSGGEVLVFSALHLMSLAPGIKTGNIVQPGALLGYSGGVSSGVPCPTQRQYSKGAHLHVELTHGPIPPYTTYDPRNPTSESYPINPSAFLASLRASGIAGVDATGSPVPITAGDYTGGSTQLGLQVGDGSGSSSGGDSLDSDPGAAAAANGLLVEVPGFFGICAALDVAEQYTPYNPPGGLTGAIQVPGYTTKWVIKNGLAFVTRATIWAIGAFLLLALIAAMININKWLQEAGGIVLPLAIAAM